MPKKSKGPDGNSQVLPDDVFHLIIRKLRYEKREYESRLRCSRLDDYKKLEEIISTRMAVGKKPSFFCGEVVELYKEIISNTIAIIKEWPGIVWSTIESVLGKTQGLAVSGEVLNSIVNKFAWVQGQENMRTLGHIGLEHFEEILYAKARSQGYTSKDIPECFSRSLKLSAAAGHAWMYNTALHAREEAGIAIEEYLIERYGVGEVNKQNLRPINAKNPHPLAIFQAMDNIRFKEIKFCIDPERLVLRITVRGKHVAVPFNAIGITKKNEITLNRHGELFMGIANGTYDSELSRTDRALSRLSESLRKNFDISDPPFRLGKPQFQISIPKDKDAQKRAIKRTTTYDDTRKATVEVNAQAFLQANDPDFNPDDAIYSDDLDLGDAD
ncbi:MAG: hypothetical protein GY814_13135 [Gammaproteobacteria bacterium]|nr:hypothetical protein [Gammaproteobacteria bacterium]